MNKQEWLDMMQHDVKIWELAEKELKGNKITLTMRDIPWGIGDAEVTLEGIDDANSKRNAVGSYAEYIRGLIDDQINDETIELRAAQAAAFASEDAGKLPVDSGIYRGPSRVGGERAEVQEVANQEAVPSLSLPAAGNTDPAVRLSELRRFVGEAESLGATARREIKALEAYMAVLTDKELEAVSEEQEKITEEIEGVD
jgi:hypothetical protein